MVTAVAAMIDKKALGGKPKKYQGGPEEEKLTLPAK
jgi:hypothetical protein